MIELNTDTQDLRLARGRRDAAVPQRRRLGRRAGRRDPPVPRPRHRAPGDAGQPPAAVVDLVAAVTRGGPLQPAPGSTLRRRIPLVDGTGAPVGESGGRGLGARERPPRGPLPGARVAVDDAAPPKARRDARARLRAAGAGPADSNPRSCARSVGAPSTRPTSPPEAVGGDASAGGDVRHAMPVGRRLIAHDPGVRSATTPRTSTGPRSRPGGCAPTCGRSGRCSSRVERRAARGAARLGADWGRCANRGAPDRLQGRLTALPAEDPPTPAPILRRLAERWDAARAELPAALRSPRYLQLLDRLVRAAREPALLPEAAETAPRRSCPRWCAGPWRHLRDAVEGLDEEPGRRGPRTRSGSGPSDAATPPRRSRRRRQAGP